MELTQNHVQRQVVLVVLNLHEGNTLQGWKVHGTGSKLCQVAGFGVSNVESSDSSTKEL
jgi:hypothetical protein